MVENTNKKNSNILQHTQRGSIMRKVAILTALIAFLAVGLMIQGQGAVASTPVAPELSLDIQQKGKTNDACDTLTKKETCVLNVGDEFDVVVNVNALNGGGEPYLYNDWALTLNIDSKLLTPGSVTVPASACIDNLNIGTYTNNSTVTVTCNGQVTAVSTSAVLATMNIDCTAAGTYNFTLKSADIDSETANVQGATVICGESASMTLKQTDSNKPYVKDKVEVSLNISDLKLKDADGDGKAGYNGWEATITWDPSALDLSKVNFKPGGLSIPLQLEGDGTILLGASISPGQNESTQTGPVVNLSFTILEQAVGGTDVTFNGASLLTEKGGTLTGGNGLTVSGSPVSVSPLVALMTLSIKDLSGACKIAIVNNTCRMAAGDSVTVSVNLENVGVPVVKTAASINVGDGSTVTVEGVSFSTPNPCDPLNQSFSTPSIFVRAICTDSSPVQDNYANVFDIELKCEDGGTSDLTQKISIQNVLSVTNVTSEKSDPTKLPLNAGKNLTIVCVGSESDSGDNDGCTVVQEAAFQASSGVSMNPNRFDLADAVGGDSKVLTADVLAYVLAFGEARTGPGDGSPPDVQDADDIIDDGDINRAVDQFGYTDCV